MPYFKTTLDLWLDGEKVQIRTRLDDQLNAERQINANPADSPIQLGSRIWWNALKRVHPDHPCSKSFRSFTEALERNYEYPEPEDEDEDAVGPLDPTREVESDT